MAESGTLSRRGRLRFWGWGYEEELLSPQEEQLIDGMVGATYGSCPEAAAEPVESDFELHSPRLQPPESLSALVSITDYDRLTHAYGKSFADNVRMLMRHVPHPPDAVAFPKSEEDVVRVLDWAASANAAVIPFGGGTSVCGGVEPDVGDSYGGTISLDMQYFDRVLEIDRVSRAARVQSGANGTELEAQLRPEGLTLRHFPQSFQFSTVGGWIATRAGGHYASLYTHIDDFVESVRMVTPGGNWESRRLPGSGAGPSPDRMVIGSEGTLGVITETWLRLQDRPTFRASTSVAFPDMASAVNAVRALSQSGLFPTNCRLLDPAEVKANFVGDGKSPTLVLGFESADHPLNGWMQRALELVADHGGRYDAASVKSSQTGDDAGQRDEAASTWRQAFLRMPYYRDRLTSMGVIADTFETAITWDRFDALYDGVYERVADAILRITGHPGRLSCRFTHIYPDGPAPYFSYSALGSSDGDLASALDRWREIKIAASEAVVSLGGTITHHHAVGRDHRPGYEAQSPPLFRQALAAAKHSLDPQGLLNPGVLIDPQGRLLGVRGVLK